MHLRPTQFLALKMLAITREKKFVRTRCRRMTFRVSIWTRIESRL